MFKRQGSKTTNRMEAMTLDFLQDAVEQFEHAGYPYLIIIQPPHGQNALVKSNLDGWKTGKTRATVKEDILQLLDVTAFADN